MESIAIYVAATVLIIAFMVVIVLKGRLDKAQYRDKARWMAEKSVLEERLQYKETALEQEKQTNAQNLQEITQMRSQLEQEQQRRATAEEKNQQIPSLQAEISRALEQGHKLTEHNTTLQTQIAELEARLAAEQKAMQEKMVILNEAQAQLSDAFKALSAEALQHNYQSFLDLARTTQDKYQQGAQGDLDMRQ